MSDHSPLKCHMFQILAKARGHKGQLRVVSDNAKLTYRPKTVLSDSSCHSTGTSGTLSSSDRTSTSLPPAIGATGRSLPRTNKKEERWFPSIKTNYQNQIEEQDRFKNGGTNERSSKQRYQRSGSLPTIPVPPHSSLALVRQSSDSLMRLPERRGSINTAVRSNP